MAEKVQELIDILTENQKKLDSKKKIKLRYFVADLNFSLLSIFEKIKENLEVEPEEKTFSSTMFS